MGHLQVALDHPSGTRRITNGYISSGGRSRNKKCKSRPNGKGSKIMVVHYTLQGSGCASSSGKEPKESCACPEQTCEPDHKVGGHWWAAQVASNKEYDTKREILSTCDLEEDDVLIPRRMIYDVKNDKVDKKTEMVLPGYLLLRLGNQKIMRGLQMMRNYIEILGRVSPDEMEIVREYENIPKETDAHTGDKIIITKGPFAGVKGVIIEEHDDKYCKCRLLFQGNEIVTDMDKRIVERIA